ncbi:tripartite tricarboxylate transporter TctB family protein [Agrococcus sp. ProA11]|uniref:tripartite tricarboxylate transporter TctB family protein n=1 Tax=Agrococcus chionoecetis TaxID=3153752 RepID=UPI0032616CA1
MTDIAPASAPAGARRWTRDTAIELVAALALLLVTIVYLVLAGQIELRREAAPGQMDARAWPTFLGVAAVAAAGLLVLRTMLRGAGARDEIEAAQPGALLRVGGTVLIALGYLALWSVGDIALLGLRLALFPVATALTVAALLLLYGHRGWKGLIIYPIALATLNWVLFAMILRIPL